MPRIIDYPTVLKTLTAQGLRCNYPNGGAFGFAPADGAVIRGWIGPADPTIRPQMLPMVRQVPPPFEVNLAGLACEAWQTILPGPLWLMPASHWAFEMQHGNGAWLAEAIRAIGLDPLQLMDLTDAAAIEFSPAQPTRFRQFAQRLLEDVTGSDFVMALVGRQTVCTIHHHKQLWWETLSAPALTGLDALLPANPTL